MTSEIPSLQNSRWRSPPSWISKNCCHFFNYLTDRHQNLWKHLDFVLKQIDDMGNAYLKKFKMAVADFLNLEKTVAISLLFDQSSPNFVGIFLLWFRSHRWSQKIYVTIIQYGGRLHLGFRKAAAISLLFDRSSPNLVEILGLWLRTYLLRWKCIVA